MPTTLPFAAVLLLLGLAAARGLAGRTRAADVRGRLAEYGYGAAALAEVQALAAPAPGPFAALGARLLARAPRAQVEEVRRELLAAGEYDTPVERVLATRAVALVLVPLLFVWFGVQLAGLPGGLGLGLLGAFVGYALPRIGLQRAARGRLERVDIGMPELVDLLVVAVESGMGLGAALSLASDRVEGPLGDELRLVLQEQGLGVNLSEALRHLLERCETPAVRAFVTTIVQGERLGVSIGQMMRSLAVDMRKRRRAAAEEQAHKTPVKILFPLALLIFPALFIVLLAPAALSLLGSGFGG